MDHFEIDLDKDKRILNITCNDFNKVLNVGLSDLNGKVIYRGNLPNESHQIDVSKLKSGTYRLYLVCEEQVFEKIFKY